MRKGMIAGLCLGTALVLAGCGGQKQAERSTENNATVSAVSETAETDTVYVGSACYLPDVKAEHATKLVLNENVCLKDYDPGETEAHLPPNCQSWFAGCPKVSEIEVRQKQSRDKTSDTKDGFDQLYTEQGLLMYRGKSQGVYACPIPKTGKVTVPDGTQDIYDCAFYDCSGITEIVLPPTVCWTGTAAFANAASLKEIVVEKGNSCLKSVDGVLYTKDGRVLLAYPAGKKDRTYRVPAGVRYIADGAFAGAENLQEITLPKGLFYLGDLAFKNCSGLKKIHAHKVYYGNSSAYAYCDALPSGEWVKSEEEKEGFPWEADYRDDFMRNWNDKFPWKFNMGDYGSTDVSDIIDTLKEFHGKVPAKLAKKIKSLQHNYAKNVLWAKAVTVRSFGEFENIFDHFTDNYGK